MFKPFCLIPAGLGDNHLCAVLVELLPELLVLQGHLGVVLHIVVFVRRRGRRGAGRERPKRQAGKEAGIAVGRGKAVCRP